ncbi:MAG: formate dehydrogenase [Rubrivivax sp.]
MTQDASSHREPQEHGQLSRRTLFAGAGAVGALAATAVVLRESSLPPQAQAASPEGEPHEGRYRLSAHVLRYDQTARV